MTKKEELHLIDIIIEAGGVLPSLAVFFQDNAYRLTNTYDEFYDVFKRYRQLKCIDANFLILPRLYEVRTQQEVELLEEKKENKRTIRHLDNQARLVNWQVKSFWFIFGLALVGGLNAIYNILKPSEDLSQYIKKSEVEILLKDYVNNEKHKNDLIGMHDSIYNDTNLINRK